MILYDHNGIAILSLYPSRDESYWISLYVVAVALLFSVTMKRSDRRRSYTTITEAAKQLGITRAAVHRAIKQGRLEAERGEIVRTIVTRTHGWKISPKSLTEYRVSLLHQWVGKKIA
jgi:hypothetical protein